MSVKDKIIIPTHFKRSSMQAYYRFRLPRNVDPSVEKTHKNITLINVDGLKDIAENNINKRKVEVEKVKEILIEEQRFFNDWLTKREQYGSDEIRLGSRPSKLALIQAEMVKSQLLKQFPKLNIQIIPIATQGDQDQISSLKQLGGKGVLSKALEQALIKREIDAAVHSFKDITAQIEEQTQLTAFLKPEAIEDCLILANKQNISDLNSLPEGSIIATSSMRRQLLLSTYYPHLKTKEIRGNVETRIKMPRGLRRCRHAI